MTQQDIDFRFVCTDRGQHPSRELQVVTYRVEGDSAVALARGYRYAKRRRSVVQQGSGGWQMQFSPQGDPTLQMIPLWRFRCPTCRRDKQIKQDELLVILPELHKNGVASVDISAL